MRRALPLLLACACGLPGGDVLTKTPPVLIDDCDQARAEGKDGLACSGFESCALELPPCCSGKIVCISSVLKVIEDCSACSTCSEESSCDPGTWCISGRCDACPKADSCKACPDGLVQLERNGCPTCDCGPPPQTDGCPPNGKPSPGKYCVAGCVGLSCCGSQCTPEGCGPSPAGCSMPCGAVSCGGACFATECTCSGGTTWSCTARCSPGSEAFTSRCEG